MKQQIFLFIVAECSHVRDFSVDPVNPQVCRDFSHVLYDWWSLSRQEKYSVYLDEKEIRCLNCPLKGNYNDSRAF